MAKRMDSKAYQRRAETLESIAKHLPTFGDCFRRAAVRDRNRASEAFAKEIGILL